MRAEAGDDRIGRAFGVRPPVFGLVKGGLARGEVGIQQALDANADPPDARPLEAESGEQLEGGGVDGGGAVGGGAQRE